MEVLGFAGYSGSGKTTLIEALIPALGARGLEVAVIKHAHHDFDVDTPGKDSWRHRKAGAREVLVTSAQRWVLMCELGGETEPTLAQHLARLAPCDLVIVEGFKREAVPKIEIRRADHPRPLLAPADPWIIAIASDQPVAGEPLPILDLNDPSAIAEFVVGWLGRRDRRPTGDPAGELPC